MQTTQPQGSSFGVRCPSAPFSSPHRSSSAEVATLTENRARPSPKDHSMANPPSRRLQARSIRISLGCASPQAMPKSSPRMRSADCSLRSRSKLGQVTLVDARIMTSRPSRLSRPAVARPLPCIAPPGGANRDEGAASFPAPASTRTSRRRPGSDRCPRARWTSDSIRQETPSPIRVPSPHRRRIRAVGEHSKLHREV